MDWYRLLPKYWLQIEPTCGRWDKILNDALDTGSVKIIDNYTAKVGGLQVWIESWPYGYGAPYEGFSRKQMIPKVATRKRLRRAVDGILESERNKALEALAAKVLP